MNNKSVLSLSVFAVFLALTTSAEPVDTAWTRFYSGQANRVDFPSDVVVDDSKNVIVTGHSTAYGHTYFDPDVLTIKYGPGGDTAWIHRYNSVGDNSDKGILIAIGGDGNIVVAGTINGQPGGTDILVIKYTPSGDTLWIRTFDGSSSSTDLPKALAVDATGQVWIGAITYNGGYSDYLVVHYNAAGTYQWSDEHDVAGGDDVVNGLALDPSGNSYITGYIWDGSDQDIHTRRYSPTGTFLGGMTYDGPAGMNDHGKGIVYGSGYLYVLGGTVNGSNDNDAMLIKYNLSGDTVWTRRYVVPAVGPDNAKALRIDPAGHLIVAAEVWESPTLSRLALIKYETNGDTTWARHLSPSLSVKDMALDASGNVYLAAWGRPPGDVVWTDWMTVKYTSTGDSAWAKWRYNGVSSGGLYWPNGIAVDNAGGVVVVGVVGINPDQNYMTRKYAQSCCLNRGDIDHSGGGAPIDISDLVYIVDYMFNGGPAPPCDEEGNVDGVGTLDISDLVYLVDFMFTGGPPPPGC